MAEIQSIVLKPRDGGPDPDDHYRRVAVDEATLVAGRGLAGDAKAVPTRQLNVMSADTVAQLRAEGFKTAPGELGEQIVIRGLDLENLPAGTRLQLGAEACIELVKLRTGCDRFTAIQNTTLETTTGRLGLVARVLAGGLIRVGDMVVVLAAEAEAQAETPAA